MIIRFVQVRTSDAEALRVAYERVVIPALRSIAGCLSATLLQNGGDRELCISMTVWRSSEDAKRYEQQGRYNELLETMRPYIAESTEWRIQLGDDLTVRYEPVAEAPTVQQFAVETGGTPPEIDNKASYVRIVSHRARPESVGEFRRIYDAEVVPVLLRETTCKHAYLVADPSSPTTMLSVTVWADQADARNYELSGKFTTLLAKLEPTLSTLVQWKMDVEHDTHTRVVTSEDVNVEGYQLLAGASFPS